MNDLRLLLRAAVNIIVIDSMCDQSDKLQLQPNCDRTVISV